MLNLHFSVVVQQLHDAQTVSVLWFENRRHSQCSIQCVNMYISTYIHRIVRLLSMCTGHYRQIEFMLNIFTYITPIYRYLSAFYAQIYNTLMS